MSKRNAQYELNQDNWDEENETEEAGVFKSASKEVLQGRQIVKAKRRGPSMEGSNSFSGFSGFSFKPTNTSTPFSFNVKSVTNGTSQSKQENGESNQAKLPSSSSGKEGEESKTSATYSANLKKLNESVLSWIKSHVEKNPYCILTPIFQDYEKHLESLEKEKNSQENGSGEKQTKDDEKIKNTVGSFVHVENEEKISITSLSPATSTTTATTTQPAPASLSSFGQGFKFGNSLATSAASTSNTNTSTMPAFPGFSFSSNAGASNGEGKPFSFAVSKPAEASSQDDDDEYVPPKVESKEVEEEGSMHSIKCKLFYQKDGAWNDKGVGYLHLKKPDSKLQVVVRADTSLGNIILNIMLPKEIPVKRQGKNNLNLICIPNPPIDPKAEPKPTPMLIRVKTGEDADALLEKINELRN